MESNFNLEARHSKENFWKKNKKKWNDFWVKYWLHTFLIQITKRFISIMKAWNSWQLNKHQKPQHKYAIKLKKIYEKININWN